MRSLFLFAGVVVVLGGPFVHAQNSVRLKQEHQVFEPKNFHVQDVVDDRDDKGTVGSIKGGPHSGPVNIFAGAGGAMKGYIANNVTQNRSTPGIVIRITRLNFNIKRNGAGWNEEADVELTFEAGGKNVVEYSGKGTRTTEDDPLIFVDEFVRKTIETDIKRFDAWWEQNGSKVPMSSAVKVVATIGKAPKKPENIPYSLQRPLQINDFTGPAENNVQEQAATLSGTGLETSGEVVNNQLVLNVVVTPYFNTALSWFRQEGRTAQVLAHEQAHFDITAIKACELLNRIRNTVFTEDNYNAKLQELMQWNTDETDKAQKLYDAETNHGTIKDKQLEWQKRITAQVREIGCY